MLKIDIHTHIMPEQLPRWAERFGYGGFIHLEHHRAGFARMMEGKTFFREVAEDCWNPAVRIPFYEQHATQVQVICTIPVLFAYWAKAEHCAEVARFLNDGIAEIVAARPTQYIGLGTLPMQDTELAIKELERCKAIGLVGVQIGSNVNNLNLNEPQFDAIWAACERLDMAIMVHPWQMMGQADMAKYWLPWLVGMPAETSRAICSMIFGGVFDRFPKLRVCFAHAGGSFFATIGRIEHGFNCRPDLVAIDNPNNPRNYLGRFWVDCITHDATALQHIIDRIGTRRICLGTDYPFPLGDLEVGAFLDTLPLSTQQRADIFHGATLEWLGLSADKFASK